MSAAENGAADESERQVVGIGMYEVEPGDNLWEIAEKLWGDGRRYPQLYAQNRDILTDPDVIRPGQVLAYFMEVGQQFSYADLANFTALEEIILGIDLPEYPFFSVMPRLESIIIYSGKKVENLDFLRGRTELKSLRLAGGGFGAISDLSVLKNCTKIEYLWLDTPGVTDFSLLKECTEVKNFIFTGSAKSDADLFPNAEYLELDGERYRRDEGLGENPGL